MIASPGLPTAMRRDARRGGRDQRMIPKTHDSEKACPGLDSGLTDVSDKIMRKDKKVDTQSELNLRRLIDRLAVVAEIEERPRREAENAGEQRRGELLDAGIVLADRIVEEPPRRRDLVLDVGQLGLQLLEIRIGLEVGIALRQREYLPQRARQHVFGGALRGRPLALGGDRGIARLDHRFERPALVRRIAFHGLDQVGNEIVALLELNVDV